MKHQHLLLIMGLLCLLGNALAAQKEINAKDQYFVVQNEVVVQPINFLTEVIADKRLVLFREVVFDKVRELQIEGTNYSLIKPIQYVKKRSNTAKAKPFPSVEMGQYYVVKSALLANNTLPFTPKTWALRAGVVNIPVKFYLPDDGDPLDFSSRSVSLGTSIGAAQQVSNTRRNLWISYLLGAQFTMVTPTTDDFVNFNNLGGNSNTLSAFSLSLGIALDFEGIEVGFFLGKDYLPGSAAKDWKHNGDTWLSIGVGTSLSGGKEQLTNY